MWHGQQKKLYKKDGRKSTQIDPIFDGILGKNFLVPDAATNTLVAMQIPQKWFAPISYSTCKNTGYSCQEEHARLWSPYSP
jgi:hypothetical protein